MGVSEEHLERAGYAWPDMGEAKPGRAEPDEDDAALKMRAALDRLQAQMDEAEPLLFDAAEPAFTYKVLDAGQLTLQGASLARHLEGCGRLVVMAVTLGPEVDELISETQRSRIALGVVVDSGASVMTELAANTAEAQIRAELAASAAAGAGSATGSDIPKAAAATAGTAAPLYMTARFSPGYGDSPLEMQEQVLDALNAEQQLGITLSKGYMMHPSKSITAIMGLADHPVTGRLATCEECVLRDKCQLREEGMRCGQGNES